MSVTATYSIDSDRLVVEVFTDHLGQSYSQVYFAPQAWGATELQAHLDAGVTDMLVRLADGEFERLTA
jgi:hypothetical protein